MAYAPWKYDDSPTPEERAQAEQTQFVSTLQTWPPQGGAATAQQQRPVSQSAPRITPWVFLLFGLILWPSALITGIWALNRVREGERDCVPIAALGLGLAALNITILFLIA